MNKVQGKKITEYVQRFEHIDEGERKESLQIILNCWF